MEIVYLKTNAFRSEVYWAVRVPKAMAFAAFVSNKLMQYTMTSWEIK